ncbi:MAG: 3',5'-cyclic nucleotide phosphodiesterase [Alphaproteobacteria bacterium]|nr:3',5'-cyclic nucleotide phosphodiesterase [Alphaproteobacteria bacterium]
MPKYHLDSKDILTNDLSLRERLRFLAQEDGFLNWAALEAGLDAMGAPPGLWVQAATALDELAPQVPQALREILQVAAVLGSVPNDLPYHNNRHYRNVMQELIRLIHVHNKNPEAPFPSLNAAQIVTLLVAVCIHDLGHDGAPDPARAGHLEQKSVDLGAPFLRAFGASAEMLKDLEVIVLCTHVADPPVGLSNAAYLKAAVLYHKGQGPKPSLPPMLEPLAQRRDLVIMALLMHEADIAISSGIDYAHTRQETILLAREGGQDTVRPSQILAFLDRLCDGPWRSAASRKLYDDNRATIRAAVQADISSGDHPL